MSDANVETILSLEERQKMNIYEKMSYITNELKNIEKDLTVSTGNKSSYKALSETAILNAVKPLEQKYGVYSYAKQRRLIESNVFERENKSTGNKSNTYFMRIEVIYKFVNIDNPQEVLETTTFADGLDNGDKASGKAMTYADKYALMKSYKISTGEDPDQQTSNPKNDNERFEISLDMYVDENYAREIIKLTIYDLIRKNGIIQAELNSVISKELWTDLSHLNAHQLLKLEEELSCVNMSNHKWHELYNQNSKIKEVVQKDKKIKYIKSWERLGREALKLAGGDIKQKNKIIEFYLNIGYDFSKELDNEDNRSN